MAQQVRSFEYVSTNGTEEGLVLPYQEADSQTFVEGDLVLLNAAGDISLATADGTNQILGIAKGDATNVTSGHAQIPVQVIRPFDMFKANYEAGKTFAIAQIGENHLIVRTAAGNWQVDPATTAADARVKVLGSLEYTADGLLAATDGGPIYCRFLQADSADEILQFSTDASV